MKADIIEKEKEKRIEYRLTLIGIILWLILGFICLKNWFAFAGIIIIICFHIIPVKIRYTIAANSSFTCVTILIYFIVYFFFLINFLWSNIWSFLIDLFFILLPLVDYILYTIYLKNYKL